MSVPLCILRPEPGWGSTAAAATDLGIEVVGAPLFAGEPVGWRMPQGPFDGLLIGSARVFELGGEGLASLRDLPVYAVGNTSADAAHKAGFSVAAAGTGDLQQLLGELAGGRLRLLRLMGEDHVALQPPPGIALAEIVTYRVDAHPVSAGLAALVRQRTPVIALHSAGAARHWRSECERLGVARQLLVILALSHRVATAAGGGWNAVHVADSPGDAALLAKAKLLCEG